MRLKILMIVFNIFCSQSIFAQADTMIWRINAQNQARRLDTTFKEKNWIQYAQLNHPNLVKAMGGDLIFAQTVQEQMRQIDSLVKIDTMYFGAPYNFIACDSSINCLLPQTMLISISDTTQLRSRVYLVGSSEDNGLTWYFVDGSNGAEYLNIIIPKRCDQLIIPQKQQAIIRRKQE